MEARRIWRGLDWLFFFVADLQTGFGPFIAVYLTDHRWTQAEIGLALGTGSAAGILAQVPAGVLVDMLRNKAVAAAAALTGTAMSAMLMALSPTLLPVLLAEAVFGFAGCMLNPAMAALTLGLVKAQQVAERLGRNARFAAIGSAVGAALMGACGTYVSTRGVFWLAALFCVPALIALRSVGWRSAASPSANAATSLPPTVAPPSAERTDPSRWTVVPPSAEPTDLAPRTVAPPSAEATGPSPPITAAPLDPPSTQGATPPSSGALATPREPVRHVLLDRRLLTYVVCVMLFQLTNASLLPLAGVEITKRADKDASLIIAACILVPQLVVALLSPLSGRAANRWGRRWVLLAGFCALPARAALLSVVSDPYWIIPVQALDGLGGAALGVMTPLVAADISGDGGRFNLRMGIIGLAVGAAATVSYTVAGSIATDLGTPTAFLALALTGVCAVLTVGLAMPETRPVRPTEAEAATGEPAQS